jgi:hypothetical protein
MTLALAAGREELLEDMNEPNSEQSLRHLSR